VRIYHNPKKKNFYILRAYTPRRMYKQNQGDFQKAMESFRFTN
jgi:hypothetical protein